MFHSMHASPIKSRKSLVALAAIASVAGVAGLTLPAPGSAASGVAGPARTDALADEPPAFPEPTAEQIAYFESKVRPILVAHCYSCHSNSADRVRGGLKLDSLAAILTGGDTGTVLVPGNLDESALIRAVRYTDDDLQMPPKTRLTSAQVKVLEDWVKMGAPHPDGQVTGATPPPQKKIDIEAGRKHWAFQLPRAVSPPSTKDTKWATSPIDSFVLAGIEAHNLKPAPDADKRTWLRRVTFDLTGLPPTPEELDAFEKDRKANAYETVVDRLLASRAYGERWGRHWLDVARFAESSGKETNTIYPHAWRYRDYVISSFNADKPFNEFLTEQLAGDLLTAKNSDDRAENLIATGYLAVGTKGHNTRGRAQFMMDLADEQIDAFSQGMLGLTVACARCHDHKFDPIPQRDYYAVAGIFLSTDTKYGTYRTPGNNHPGTLLDLPTDAKNISNGPDMPALVRSAYERQMSQAEKDAAEFEELRKLQQGQRRGPDGARPQLPPGVDQQKLNRLRYAGSQLEQTSDVLARFGSDGSATAANRLAMGASERRTPMDARLLARGELEKPGETVPRGFVQVISDSTTPDIKDGSGRLELAQWVAGESNPLTARVWANRVWLHIFGKGIVPSPDNFGLSGQPPTHPELLDFLATRLVKSGWSTKSLIRDLVLSHTYRMSSREDALAQRTDPDNTWLSHMPKRRLEGEAIRDSMLCAAGVLDRTPPVGSPVAYVEGQDRNPIVQRMGVLERPVRSVYLPVMRDHIPEMLDVFDMAEPAFVSGEREKTSVPTQALYMMNSDAVEEAASKMADRLIAMKGTDNERVRAAFELAYGRKPSQGELTAVRSFFDDFPEAQGGRDVNTTRKLGWSAFCQALFQAAEFRMID